MGRTLALANLGVALARAGKKVLMLDFDYDAPGLHQKFGLPSYPGYIDYLRDVGLEQRCRGAFGSHWENLAGKIRKIDNISAISGAGELHLLGAGDETQKGYWEFLASYRFHRLFYFTEAEISGLTNLAFPKKNMEHNLNRRAFEGDLDLISKKFQPDYFLVDCKTGREANAFALLFWADRIAHFFPHNQEGQAYALEIARSIARFCLRESRTIGFVPVVSRVPDDFPEAQKDSLRQEMAKNWAQRSNFAESTLFRSDDFVFLSELRDMETKERLLVNAEVMSPDRRWILAHDQLDLFARLAPLREASGTEQSVDTWYKILGMNRNDKQFLKTFIHRPHLGTMLNVTDGQPNIAFRVRTLHLMYRELLNSTDGDEKKVFDALQNTGKAAGRDFADEFAKSLTEPLLLERLKHWADFDSGVGFGKIEIVEKDFSATTVSGTIRVTGDAFHHLPSENNNNDDEQDLRAIFIGYVQAVIEKLANIMSVSVVVVNDTSSAQKNISLYSFKDSNQ